MHKINVILNIQQDQPLGCKYLNFDPSCIAAFVQGQRRKAATWLQEEDYSEWVLRLH
jgi:hypothetical protein